MRLLFKQRLFSWFDSYDIYDSSGATVYVVKGQLSWGHCLKIFDASGNEVGMVKEKIFTFMPKFELYKDGKYIGNVEKEFTWFKPKYHLDFNGWQVSGNYFEWDYTISDAGGTKVAVISKELLNWTDTYAIDVFNPNDALYALMFVLAIDAEKCSRN